MALLILHSYGRARWRWTAGRLLNSDRFTIWNYKNKAKHFAKELEDLKKQKQTLLDDLAAINAEFELLRQEKQQPRQQDNTATAAEMTVETAGETMHDSE